MEAHVVMDTGLQNGGAENSINIWVKYFQLGLTCTLYSTTCASVVILPAVIQRYFFISNPERTLFQVGFLVSNVMSAPIQGFLAEKLGAATLVKVMLWMYTLTNILATLCPTYQCFWIVFSMTGFFQPMFSWILVLSLDILPKEKWYLAGGFGLFTEIGTAVLTATSLVINPNEKWRTYCMAIIVLPSFVICLISRVFKDKPSTQRKSKRNSQQLNSFSKTPVNLLKSGFLVELLILGLAAFVVAALATSAPTLAAEYSHYESTCRKAGSGKFLITKCSSLKYLSVEDILNATIAILAQCVFLIFLPILVKFIKLKVLLQFLLVMLTLNLVLIVINFCRIYTLQKFLVYLLAANSMLLYYAIRHYSAVTFPDEVLEVVTLIVVSCQRVGTLVGLVIVESVLYVQFRISILVVGISCAILVCLSFRLK